MLFAEEADASPGHVDVDLCSIEAEGDEGPLDDQAGRDCAG
jgi:hypothetical protein